MPSPEHESRSSVAPGRRFRLAGKKELLKEIRDREGSMIEVTGLILRSQVDQTGVAVGGNIRIAPGPTPGSAVGANPNYYATCFDGRQLHASARGAGARMYSYDLSDRSRFVAEDNRLVIDEQLYCGTQDQYVFQGAQFKVHKVDVSNPLNHVEVGRGGLFPAGSEDESHSDHGQVAPLGNLLFIGNDHGSGSGFMVHQMAPDTTAPAATLP